MSSTPRLSVVGLGKLGSPMAACFAAKGFTVVGVDMDAGKVADISALRPPVFEPGLAETLAAGRDRLTATTDLTAAVAGTEATFLVVATPSGEDGTFSIEWILAACETVGRAIGEKEGYHLVVLTSTVMPGATDGPIREALERASGKRCGEDFGLCYSPEFIALGSVIRDFLNPDFLLVGESDERPGDLLASIYERTCENAPPVARMSFVNAELTKISVNTYVTTKIAFANMLARICERLPGADVDIVTAALGRDTRIGSKYLKGAVAYGGPCFPRDNIALGALGRLLGVPAAVAEATDRSNRADVAALAATVGTHLPEGGTVAVLGLSYKPSTDVSEEAAGLHLAGALAASGMAVTVFDPAASAGARRVLGGSVTYAPSAEECIAGADVIVLTTPWPELVALPAATYGRVGTPRVVIDCWRVLDESTVAAHARYVALGRGPQV